MKAKFSIARKILLFWGVSVLAVIGLIGGIFLFALNSYHEKVSIQKIDAAHAALLTFLSQREVHLQNIVDELVGRRNVISTMNLLTKYQDYDNYQALVYDPEKKKLAEVIGSLTGISDHHYLAIFDGRDRLSAIHGHVTEHGNLEETYGYVGEDLSTTHFLRIEREGLAHIQLLPQALVRATDSLASGTFFYAGNNGLALVVRVPIVRERLNGETDALGTAILVDILGAPVLAELSRQTGLQVGYRQNLEDAGKVQSTPTSDVSQLPSLMSGPTNHALKRIEDGYVGYGAIPVENGDPVVVSFQTLDEDLTTGVAAFRVSAVWGFIIFLVTIAPLGFVFVNRVVQKPLASLMGGVETVLKGRYGDTISLKSTDELSILAASFNDMSRAIKEREDSLEDKVRGRTLELQTEINERKTIQDALKESEAKTRQIVNSAVDGIITTDESGKILSFNTAAEKIFGYSVIEAVGKNIKMLMPRNIAERHDAYMAAYLETGGAGVTGMGRELIAKRKDGSTFLADFAINDFHHAGSVTFVGIVRDITERKEEQYRLQAAMQQLQNTQDDLVQAEKMASLGGLVAGVAHEINTPIGVGVTAVSHLKERADEMAKMFADGTLRKSQLAEFVETAQTSTGIIQANLNRASDLVRSFKQVAVDQTSEEKRQINLLDYIDEVLESLKPNLRRSKHEITVKGNRDIVIHTHPGALSQIITNLVMNSVIHAYDEDDVGHIQITAERNKKSLTLLYVDDGKGMDDDVSAKIFEPFFTTKRGSGGSGLGMHILFNQVTQTLGGSIQLHSKPGRGTAFDITIPYTADDLQVGEQS